jgi:hypothetical protein
MFTKKIITLILISFLLLGMVSCVDESDMVAPVPWEQSIEWNAVYAKREIFEQMITQREPQQLEKPGKVVSYNDYIIIVDNGNGFQIYDNRGAEPVAERYIYVPACVDVAVKDGIIFADSQPDLVALDISGDQPIVISRIRDIYHDLFPPGYISLPSKFSKENRPENTIIIDWERK